MLESSNTCIYKWAITPKLVPVRENTVFAPFAEIIKVLSVQSYLDNQSGLLKRCLSKTAWCMQNKYIS